MFFIVDQRFSKSLKQFLKKELTAENDAINKIDCGGYYSDFLTYRGKEAVFEFILACWKWLIEKK